MGPRCEVCRSTRRPLWARGIVLAEQDAVIYLRRARDTAEANRRAEGESVATLHAIRCQDCGIDHVLDLEREYWLLDESDYGDAGSVAP